MRPAHGPVTTTGSLPGAAATVRPMPASPLRSGRCSTAGYALSRTRSREFSRGASIVKACAAGAHAATSGLFRTRLYAVEGGPALPRLENSLATLR